MATTVAQVLAQYAAQLNASLHGSGLSIDCDPHSGIGLERIYDENHDLFVPYVHIASQRRFEFRYPLKNSMLALGVLSAVLKDVVTHHLDTSLRYVLPYIVELSGVLSTATIVFEMDSMTDSLVIHVTPYENGVALPDKEVRASLQQVLHASAPTRRVVECVPRRSRCTKGDTRRAKHLVKRFKRGIANPIECALPGFKRTMRVPNRKNVGPMVVRDATPHIARKRIA